MPRPPRNLGSSSLSQAIKGMDFVSFEPLQRKDLWILLILLITPFGIGNRDMKYIGKLERDDFRRASLPPIERILPFHEASFSPFLE